MTRPEKQAEIDANYDAFQRGLAGPLTQHADEFALMRAREVVGFFDAPGAAYREGLSRYRDGIFSIQEMTDEPIDVGFFSHVAY